jgi:hypothetical protein
MSRAAYALVGIEVEKIWGTIVPRFAGKESATVQIASMTRISS